MTTTAGVVIVWGARCRRRHSKGFAVEKSHAALQATIGYRAAYSAELITGQIGKRASGNPTSH